MLRIPSTRDRQGNFIYAIAYEFFWQFFKGGYTNYLLENFKFMENHTYIFILENVLDNNGSRPLKDLNKFLIKKNVLK